MVFIIKCINCKSEFDQGDTKFRLCGICNIKSKRLKSKEYMKKGAQKIKLKIQASNNIPKECRFCSNTFNGYYGRLYCSNTCRTKYNNIVKDIARTQEHMIRLNIKIEKLKILSNGKKIYISE